MTNFPNAPTEKTMTRSWVTRSPSGVLVVKWQSTTSRGRWGRVKSRRLTGRERILWTLLNRIPDTTGGKP